MERAQQHEDEWWGSFEVADRIKEEENRRNLTPYGTLFYTLDHLTHNGMLMRRQREVEGQKYPGIQWHTTEKGMRARVPLPARQEKRSLAGILIPEPSRA